MNNSQYSSHVPVFSLLTKGMIMKLITILTVGVAAVGMTCLVGSVSAANSAPGDLISESMVVAQDTSAPGGKGGGGEGEIGRTDKGTQREKKLKGGMGADNTIPEKARPGTEKNTGTGGTTGSNSERTGKSSGSPGPSSGAGSGAK